MTNIIKHQKLLLKEILPRPIRRLASSLVNYLSRLRVWLFLVWQVRGASIIDEIKLLSSAILAPITCARHLATWQDPQLLFDCTIRVPKVGIFHVRKHTDDLYHVFPGREYRVFSYHQKNLADGDVYIDVGANIGFFAILASKLVGPKGHVVAIEMIPETMNILKRNCALNKVTNITFVNKALSNHDDQTVRASVYPNHYGQSSIRYHDTHASSQTFTSVETITLDRVASAMGLTNIKLVKIDIEGAEFSAFQGCTSSFRRISHFIYEVLSSEDGHKIADLLMSNGYSLSPLDGRNVLASKRDVALDYGIHNY